MTALFVEKRRVALISFGQCCMLSKLFYEGLHWFKTCSKLDLIVGCRKLQMIRYCMA